ncbi:MAG: hypothetical protein JWO31_2781 [Phycisphaerales bacterium]|nr:hypothetical protein [Phycisphaerales bacterium]
MSFLMGSLAWWVVGAAAVSLPVLIHLLHRQKTRPVPWAAMMFLRASVLQQKHRKKVDNWLLMLLRLAVLALLVFLLGRPLLSGGITNPLASDAPVDIGVVVDHSLSTRRLAADGAGATGPGGGAALIGDAASGGSAGSAPGDSRATVYDAAVAAVARLADPALLRPSDTVSVVLAEHSPRVLTPLPVPRDALGGTLDALRKQPPGLSAGSIPDAVRRARELVGRGRNTRKVILVVSDGQRADWQPKDAAAWTAAVGQRVKGVESAVRVYDVPVAPAAGKPNLTVGDLGVSPAVVGVNRPAAVTATVVNTGPAEVPATDARLLVDGREVARQSVAALPVAASRTLRFDHSFASANSHAVEVRVDARDALDADDAAAASAYVWPALPVLVIDGQLSGAALDASGTESALRAFRRSRYLTTALLSDAAAADTPPLAKVTLAGVADPKLPALELDDYALVVVNDVPALPAVLQNKLLDYAKSGHGVWFILGRNTERGLVRDQLAAANLMHLDVADQQAAAESPVLVDVREPQHPTLAGFAADPARNGLAGLTALKWWSVKPRDADARVPLATATGDPLMIDRPIGSNGGRVVVWTTPVDGASGWNNWPTVRAFAPLVNVTAYHLAAGWTKGQENRRLDSGQPLVWTGPADPPVAWAEVTRPDGTKARARPLVRDARQIVRFSDTYLPGRYELRFDRSELPPVYYGVGIDRRELDEAALTDDDRAWLAADDHKYVERSLAPTDLAAALGGGGGKGVELWPLLAGGLLAFLLAETFMTWRVMRRQVGPAGGVGAVGLPAAV